MIIVLILIKLASLKPMRKRWLWVAVTLGVVLFTPIIKLYAATAFTGCGGEFVAATNSQAEAQVVALVNEERAKVGLPPYKMVHELTEAARYHSADMAADRYRDHYTKDRDANDTLVTVCTWNTRVKKYYPTYDQFTENVGNGTSSPSVIMNAWMNSTGHKANILGDYREIGVGYDSLYWTQDFTTRYDVYPLVINREAQQSTSSTVSLYLYGSWAEMRLRNEGGAWGEWQAFQNDLPWTLTNQAGTRLVEVEMRNAQTTTSSSDTIELVMSGQTVTPTATQTPLPTVTSTTTPTTTSTTVPTATNTAIPTATATVTPTSLPPTPQAAPSITPTVVSSTDQLIYLPVVQR